MKQTSFKRAYTAPRIRVFHVEAEGVLASSNKVSFTGTGGATFDGMGYSTDDLDSQPSPASSAAAVFKMHNNADALE